MKRAPRSFVQCLKKSEIRAPIFVTPWPTGDITGHDPLCGQSGNSLFFDSTVTSPEPKPDYNTLLSRCWAVLESENFSLPEDEEENPCVEPEPESVAPELSALTASLITRTSAQANWTSDIAVSSQVEIFDVLRGVTTVKPLDSSLKTSHGVSLNGLSANRLYRIVGISRSAAGLESRTAPLDFRTSVGDEPAGSHYFIKFMNP
jgi:hypothetical protein